jgi:DNA polymerase-3 subunit epsilon
MSWYRDSFISFDTETTGLDFANDRAIQIGVSQFRDSEFVGCDEWLVNTGVPSAPEALATHGIPDEDCEKHGFLPIDSCLKLKAYIQSTHFLVIMNAPFDLNFILAEFARLEMNVEIPYVIDPLVISRFYEKNRIPSLAKGRRTLKALSERYGIHDYPLHSAGHDSRRVGELAIQMGQRHGQLGRSPISELDKKQRKWHRNWCDDFASFADAKGFMFTTTDWPYQEAQKWQNRDAQLPLPGI